MRSPKVWVSKSSSRGGRGSARAKVPLTEGVPGGRRQRAQTRGRWWLLLALALCRGPGLRQPLSRAVGLVSARGWQSGHCVGSTVPVSGPGEVHGRRRGGNDSWACVWLGDVHSYT